MRITRDGEKMIYKFSMSGIAPDVRLKVFDQVEFHVHSALLKIHSEFFRTFLDSPDKTIPASNEFRYEWVTKIDEDGGWQLVAAEAMASEEVAARPVLKVSKGLQTKCFEDMIHAIYNEEYDVDNAESFVLLVELADYYRCLRIVSRTVGESFYKYSGFQQTMLYCPTAAISIIKAAAKLRHDEIYVDCAILLQGPWSKPRYPELKDTEHYHFARTMHGDIMKWIGIFNNELMRSLKTMKEDDPETHQEMWSCMLDAATEAVDVTTEPPASSDGFEISIEGTKEFCAPRYYRLLFNFEATNGTFPFEELLEKSRLLDNEMDINSDCMSGSGDFKDYFFCGNEGTDLPWDTTAEDW